MEQLSDLKAILHSKRANIYYLEKCRVMQKDGRVLYLSEASKEHQYWNIPIANTTCLLLGTGTSITQAAMRMLAQAGVLVGFCGSGATPLLMANEIEWLTPQSEYRSTEYIQGWMRFWFDDHKRLEAAKRFQVERINFLEKVWAKDRELRFEGFDSSNEEIKKMLHNARDTIGIAPSVGKLLQIEADLTKRLYKHAAKATGVSGFVREHNSADLANDFLNHGNYLAYGLAATTLWVLGIPHGFAVMHGKTRRGALVFDVADLIKDALVLPWAFIAAKERMDENGFRAQCLQAFVEHGAMDFMFNRVKEVALAHSDMGEEFS
ncbi:type I-F CRISPR-associated endonuclease Cas1f [Sulfuricurvum sp.]|uniref:type I-F CRISPR-associated endonuclease Cas1f n=1 Tax=Sulfuricurvum sp. TaxID=2025608 RepID=UPI002601F580|nr:type I-F CRISPR-associated endonuclease Cas1f [Sulfuricurvum sp.]MDD3596509.1 type I-F CRISPR-associated endonuclease Cas1f [Sulfuricurvum sp.]